MKLTYFILILFLSIKTCFSQTHIYKHYGVDEGLPSAEVYDIYQDKNGYIWFATDKGLSRFNGYEFKNYTVQDGLLDNTILDFYPQNDGTIWCYGYNSQKLFYFNDNFDGFKAYKHNDILKNQIENSSILKSVVFDKEGTLYAGGYSMFGLITITDDGKSTKQFNSKTDSGKSLFERKTTLGILKDNNTFFSVYKDYPSNNKTLFFKLFDDISSRLDFAFLNNETTVFINKKLGVLSSNGSITYYENEQFPIGLKKINNHSFFVGYYSNGAEIRDTSGMVTEKLLSKKSVSSFFIDAENSYWLSTLDDGIFHIKNPNIKVFSEAHIASLVKDQNNTLYAGFMNGNIAQISKLETTQLYKGLNDNNALVEFDSKNNELYGYSDKNLVNYSSKKPVFIINAGKLPEHIGDSLLSSSYTYFNERYKDTIKRHVTNYKVQDICDYNNRTLIGTSSGLYTEKNGVIEKHQPLDMLSTRIDDIDLNKNTNTVYMATQGHGVIVHKDNIFYSINKSQGLTNSIISEIHIENDSTIWACSNSGLNKIEFAGNKKVNITTITKADGLLSNDIEDIEIINDTIWVATKKGLCYFKKDFLAKKEASNILSLQLKNVSVNTKTIESKNLDFKYDENNINFSLQAISHKNTKEINYLYRLKEVDTNWAKTKSRTINFPSLSPGNYTFQAKARVFNNISRQTINYKFKILPPFWKSWWFYGLCIILLAGLIYAFFKYRLLTYNKEITRELIRLAIKRLKRKELIYKFKSNGEEFKIPTRDIKYIKSDGNYLDIVSQTKTYTIRCKIGDFINTTPDALEYLRIQRSFIIRIDQVTSKGRNWVVIDNEKIPVGKTYLKELTLIQF